MSGNRKPEDLKVTIVGPQGDAAVALANMDEYSRENFCRKTCDFIRRVMRNPEYRAKIDELASRVIVDEVNRTITFAPATGE